MTSAVEPKTPNLPDADAAPGSADEDRRPDRVSVLGWIIGALLLPVVGLWELLKAAARAVPGVLGRLGALARGIGARAAAVSEPCMRALGSAVRTVARPLRWTWSGVVLLVRRGRVALRAVARPLRAAGRRAVVAVRSALRAGVAATRTVARVVAQPARNAARALRAAGRRTVVVVRSAAYGLAGSVRSGARTVARPLRAAGRRTVVMLRSATRLAAAPILGLGRTVARWIRTVARWMRSVGRTVIVPLRSAGSLVRVLAARIRTALVAASRVLAGHVGVAASFASRVLSAGLRPVVGALLFCSHAVTTRVVTAGRATTLAVRNSTRRLARSAASLLGLIGSPMVGAARSFMRTVAAVQQTARRSARRAWLRLVGPLRSTSASVRGRLRGVRSGIRLTLQRRWYGRARTSQSNGDRADSERQAW